MKEGGTREDLMNGRRGMKGILETGFGDGKVFQQHSAEVDPRHVALLRIMAEAWSPMRMTRMVKVGMKDIGPE